MKYVNMTAPKLQLQVTTGCVNASTTDDCIDEIKNNTADLVTLDGGRVYTAGEVLMYRAALSPFNWRTSFYETTSRMTCFQKFGPHFAFRFLNKFVFFCFS